MRIAFIVIAFCFLSVFTQAQNNIYPTTGTVGIATGSTLPNPPIGTLQIGLAGNASQHKVVIPGIYGFEKLKLGQYYNGSSGVEFINHIDFVSSYGVRLLANVDSARGLQFQYAPAVSDENSLVYKTSMFIRATDGYVGIGTTKPQSLLAVKGTITTQKVVVTQTGWADYVFEPTYQLPSLQSVENFILFNKHLPDVPSAAAVAKEGIDLGNNQAVLLKKIEELTLYLIEQNKELKEQKTLIEDQQLLLQTLGEKIKQLQAQ